jgi:hypothetical protein
MHFCSLCACPKLFYIIPKGEFSFCIPSEFEAFKIKLGTCLIQGRNFTKINEQMERVS